MRKFQVKPRFWLLMTFAMIMVFSVTALVSNDRLTQENERLSARAAELDQLILEIGRLEEEIRFVQTDEYVERAARDELGLIMPGEIRYVNSGL